MANWVIILAGGSGTRLWPLSRRLLPKQFLPLLAGGETLIAATRRRAAALAPLARTLVVTAASQADEVRRALPELPVENLLAEPEARNTAPCIGLAAHHVAARDPEGIMAVLPSDQFIADEAAFHVAAGAALALAAEGEVVALGLRPRRPETGYGYIECGERRSRGGTIHRVERFVEKPDRATAERYLASGVHLWNAGMFFFTARRLLDELGRHLPELSALLAAIAAAPERAAELYPRAAKISIDYGVMEKLPGAMYVVPADLGWSDVGSFAALPEILPADEHGNVTSGGHILAIDARRNVLAAAPGTVVAVVGVDDLVVVATRDAVLVVPRERAQEVKQIVEALTAAQRHDWL